MSSINDDIFDRSIDHSAMTRLAENGIQSDVQRIIRRHKDRLRKGLSVKGTNVTSKATLNSTIKPEVSRFVKELDSTMGAKLKEVGLAEVDFTTNNLNKSMSRFAVINRPHAGKILDEIVGTNIKGDGTFSARIRGLGSSELTRIQGAISNGVSKGLTQKQIIRDVIGTTKLTSAQATTLVRTGITRTQTVAQLRTYEGNKEIIKGMRFTAVLDNKTSPICAHHDGQVYEVDDHRFAPPLHWRCRSTLVPVVKSHSELLEGKSDIVKKTVLNTLKAQGVARLSGASPSKENYGTWLKRQSQDVKLRHLGGDATKVELFNKGQIPLKNFTNPEGKSLSIAALRSLDNKSTATVPTKQRVISAAASAALQVQAPNPRSLIRNSTRESELRTFFRTEANNVGSTLSLVDYRGTSVVGKRASRRRSNNQFDERNIGADPLTGEVKSTLVYSPDFTTLQERIDYLKASKTLSIDEKNFIERFALSLENDGLSINQQTAVVENLRVIFERFARDKRPWENSVAVIRNELKNSVVNTSRILDRRSRARASQFASFNSGSSSEASVQILGRHTLFDDIAARTLSNQRLVRDWDSTDGLALARKAFLTGRAPLANYFPALPKFLPRLPTVRASILKQIEKLPFGGRLSRMLQGQPNDSLLVNFLKSGNESLRRILDLEWTYALLREDYIRKSLLPSTIRKREKQLAKIMKSVATGKSTDYDTLSINIGKQLYQNNKSDFEIFFPNPSLPDFHKAGSKILDGLKAQGKIKIGLRGTTRRGILDLDSGRPELGSFKDTISREVTIVDPAMLALQRASRELVYSRRIGIVNDRDRIYAEVGKKNYVDARGRDTGESAITRRAGANYDTDLVDRDFTNMLNHAMDSEWEVDSDFASFFTDLVHFRDPRGNVAKFDDLNGFRKIILARGDAGAGLIQTVKWHLQRGGSFRNPVQIDGRGRVYSVGYLHPAGGELIRPFINSAQRVAFTPEILYEMKIQIGALVGEASTVLTNTGRIAAFEANEKALRELGELLLSKTQRPARLRSFLEHPLVQATDPDHLPKLARFALEYTRVYNHTNGNLNSPSLKTYFTRLTSENDASASGAQLIAMSTRNMQLAQNSNVVATSRKNRLYDLVAEATMSDIRFRQINIANDLTFADMAKAAKGQNMVAFYGAARATQAAAIETKLAKVLAKKEYTIISVAEIRGVNKAIDEKIKAAQRANAPAVEKSLRELKAELNEIVNNGAPIGNRLIAQARDSHPDVEDFVNKLTNVRTGLVGPKQFQQIASIMSEKLGEIAPITERYVDFWKDVAKIYITESERVDIPWVTVDGKTLFQRYRPTVQHRIDFTDPVTGRRVANVFEDTTTDGSLQGKVSIIAARLGLGVNGNHMNDATLVRQFHLWGRKNNVATGTVHDAFFTNIGYSLRAKVALRKIYADAVEGETMLKTLQAMRARGLSEASYQSLLKRAIRDGLINPKNPLTSKEILAPIPPGWDWYGIGP